MIVIPFQRTPVLPVSQVSRIRPGSFPRWVVAMVCLACAGLAGAAEGWTGLPNGGSNARAEKATPSGGAPSGSDRPGYGLLWLQIEPDEVAISLDGEYLDKDVWLVSLPPGNHVLRVTKPGFLPRESRFGIAAGQNLRLDVKLLPDSGG